MCQNVRYVVPTTSTYEAMFACSPFALYGTKSKVERAYTYVPFT